MKGHEEAGGRVAGLSGRNHMGGKEKEKEEAHDAPLRGEGR